METALIALRARSLGAARFGGDDPAARDSAQRALDHLAAQGFSLPKG